MQVARKTTTLRLNSKVAAKILQSQITVRGRRKVEVVNTASVARVPTVNVVRLKKSRPKIRLRQTSLRK